MLQYVIIDTIKVIIQNMIKEIKPHSLILEAIVSLSLNWLRGTGFGIYFSRFRGAGFGSYFSWFWGASGFASW